MDRDWMYYRNRTDEIYIMGVQSFLKAAEAHRVNMGDRLIFCPCASYMVLCLDILVGQSMGNLLLIVAHRLSK
ncbi:putative Transposase-associated domain-containing protein [Helianthus anomalus]